MTQSSSFNGFTIEKHSGLTTYIPQDAFPGLNEAYRELVWCKSIE